MKDINMIRNDLKELQKYFNPEKSTYKVFNELIKHDYTAEEMINVLSKIRGVHKYPEEVRTKFLNIINSLNILKEYEERQKIAKQKEEEKLQQQAKTEELQDIIDSLEKAKKEQKEEKNKSSEVKNNPVASVNPQAVPEVKEEIKKQVEAPLNQIEEIPEDDGRLMYIILILLVIISLVVIGLFVLLY